MAVSAEIVNRARSRLGMVLNGKWRLDEIIGIGGMATVYAAIHRNQKRAAVKMLHTELSIEETVRTRFLREGYMANTVDHPGAVMVFDDDIAEDGSAFLVMELLEGETVQERLVREGALPLVDVLDIGLQVLDVLVAAHEKGIVHRDLKPDNLFLTRAGPVKLLDFGIASVRQLPIAGVSTTATGLFMGTPAFMAPEHARGMWSEVDARSDLWSLGATLFTLLTGVFVHESDTPMDTLVLAITKPAAPVRETLPDLTPGLAEVLDKALAYDKEERWPNARAMRAGLREVAVQLGLGEKLIQRRVPAPVGDGPSSKVSSNPTARSADVFTPSPRSPRSREASRPSRPSRPTPSQGSGPRRSVTDVAVTADGTFHGRGGWMGVLVALASTAILVGFVVWLMRWQSPTGSRAASGDPAVLVPPAMPPVTTNPLESHLGDSDVETAEPRAPSTGEDRSSTKSPASGSRATGSVRAASSQSARSTAAPVTSAVPKPPPSAPPSAPVSSSQRRNPFDLRY